MVIRYITVAGWRSFAPEYPVKIEGLGQVSLLIGPNNVGKSNLGRFLVWLRDELRDYKRSDWARYEFASSLSVSVSVKEVDFWLRGQVPVRAELGLSVEPLRELLEVPDWVLSDNGSVLRVRIVVTRNKGRDEMSVVPIVRVGDSDLPLMDKQGSYRLMVGRDGEYTERVTSKSGHQSLANAVCHLLATRILEIRPLRNPEASPCGKDGLSTNGGGVIAQLRSLKNDGERRGYWNEVEADLERWFGRLLDERELSFDITDLELMFRMRRNGRRFDCPIGDLGAGVAELLMLLAFLRLKEKRQYLVVMDEPEAHLHPGAVVELFRIVGNEERLGKQQLLVSTHSTTLVDAATSKWRIFRAFRCEHEGTSIKALDGSGERELLSQLGIRPSQLFLAPVTMWVEGPSDVHYWTALLAEVDSTLVVGRDVAFVIYGGASGAHLQLTESDDSGETPTERLVKVMRIAHRAVIVCDSDRAEGEGEREVVQRLRDAAKRLERHAKLVTSVGREVENMIRAEVLKEVLMDVAPTSLRGASSKKIVYEEFELGQGEAFDEVVARAARDRDGGGLTQDEVSRIRKTLNQRKTTIAERVAEIARTRPGQVFTEESLTMAKEVVAWIRAQP